MSQLNITGKVLFATSTLPLDNVRVEIWDSLGTYSWIASTQTNAQGNFSLWIPEEVADLITAVDPTIIPLYKVYKNNIQINGVNFDTTFAGLELSKGLSISSGSAFGTIVEYSEDPIEINISDRAFDLFLPDRTDTSSGTYITVKGRITNGQNVPVSDLIVNINEADLGDGVLLTSVTPDWNGYYEAKINLKNVTNTKSLSKRSLKVNAVDSEDNIIVSSGYIFNLKETITVDLSTEGTSYTVSQTEIELLFAAMMGITSSVNPFSGITSDDIDLTSAPYPDIFAYLANTLGKDVQEIARFAYAKAYSYSITVESGGSTINTLPLFYALNVSTRLTENPIKGLQEQEMRDLIITAITNNIIPSHTEDVIDAFIEAAKAYQVEVIKQATVKNEVISIEDIMMGIFDDAGDVADFLAKYNTLDGEHDPSTFWTDYQTTYGSTLTNLARKGLLLAGITGYQPEMIAFLISETSGSDSLHELATWSEGTWLTHIETLCTTFDRLIVPAPIRGEITDVENTEVKELYAQRLKYIFQSFYPLTAIRAKLDGSTGGTIIADGTLREQIVTFITNNPDFDLRKSSIYDITEENTDLTDIDDVEILKDGLAPFQRLLRVTGGMPEAVCTLIADGYNSANALTDLSEGQFTEAYADAFGGNAAAQVVYSTAYTAAFAANQTVATLSATGIGIGGPVIPYVLGGHAAAGGPAVGGGGPMNAALRLDPTYANIFGNVDFCSCDYCMSLYSPGAYFTDILNFLKGHNVTAYNELIRRRPDLIYIDLTCKNANTPLPYTDLVNELLERMILIRNHFSSTIPASYQTKGPAAELAGHPEHVYKDTGGNYQDYTGYSVVYDNDLSLNYYPNNLPFSLAAEETRTYLKHFGFSRYDAMKLFRPQFQTQPPTNEITDYSISAEFLSLSQSQADVITKTTGSTFPWIFYGISLETTTLPTGIQDPTHPGNQLIYGLWTDILKTRVDVLLNQAQITYKELLQFLSTDLLNSGSHITINAQFGYPEDTCNTEELELIFTSPATPASFFGKLYRFVRLYRTNKLSIYQWDTLFRVLGITDITFSNFKTLCRVLQLAAKLNLDPLRLTAWLSDLDTHLYTNFDSSALDKFPSVYDQIFRNKAILNVPLTVFDNPALFTTTFIENASLIAAACGIKEQDALLLFDYLGIVTTGPTPDIMTLTGLSRIYVYAQLSKVWKISVSDLLSALALQAINTLPGTPSWDNLDTIIETMDIIQASPFSIGELNYLIRNIDDRSVYAPVSIDIQLFYEGLRNELKKFLPFTNTQQVLTSDESDLVQQLVNTVYQYFSKHFNIPSLWVETMINNGYTLNPANGPSGFLGDIIDASFIFPESDYPLSEESIADILALPNPAPVLDDLYFQYRYTYKTILIATRLSLRKNEFIYFYQNEDVVGFHFSLLPIDTINPAPNEFIGLERLTRWVEIRDRLHLVEDDFINLLTIANTVPVAPVTYTTLLADWTGIFVNNTIWGDMLPELIGTIVTGNPAGILGATFPATSFRPNNLKSTTLLLKILDIAAMCKLAGLSPTTLYTALRADLTLDDSHKILLAAKSKHNEKEWLAIAKKLRDPLREMQRQALLGYILANPDPANYKRWVNANDLFAYLLIDVEMQPCMLTSRIKQGISSAQLFVDRILLGLESTAATTPMPITLSPGDTEQWETWRKWYRVWEANRKIFLYPENWIEPELRDDKTPFFEELETELLQDDVTDEHVEDIFTSYLHKLDEVARMEPVGTCDAWDEDLGKMVTHVVSRTYGEPQHHYYRRLIDDKWTPWERIEVEIKSDHVTPIIFNRRLYLFWLTFKEKTSDITNAPLVGNHGAFYNDQSALTISSISGSPTRQRVLETSLNWTEYKNGKWQKHQIAAEKMALKLHPDIEDFFQPSHYANFPSYLPYLNFVSENRKLSAIELVQSYFYMRPAIGDALYLKVFFPSTFLQIPSPPYDNANMDYFHGFRFKDSKAPEVLYWYDLWNEPNFISPTHTLVSNMRYVENPINYSNPYGGWIDKSLNIDSYVPDNRIPPHAYSYLDNNRPAVNNHIAKINTAIIFNRTDGGIYKLVSKSNFEVNPLENQFLFYDDRNTYYVRRVRHNIFIENSPVVVTNNINLSLTTYLYNNLYNQPPIIGWPIPNNGPFNGPFVVWDPNIYFQTFYHPHIHDFVKALNSKGVSNLLKIGMQNQVDGMNFNGLYDPNNSLVHPQRPTDIVSFSFAASYSIYNWELFFHLPMLIAQRLSDNQQFAEARKWFHYIFDPTSNVDANNQTSTLINRFWKFRPFYDQASVDIQTLDDLLILIAGHNQAAVDQVHEWEANPFKPHVVARMRIVAYMKNVVMKYLDNLIAWGDQLFSRNTIESINEATQMYILAANILGRKPMEVPKRAHTSPKNFSQLAPYLDAFSNAAVTIENYVAPNYGPPHTHNVPLPKMFYFCLSANDKLLGYWDTVADRLFKIRHCMDIEGRLQQLPLFEPPIDPALLVRATAAGLDINSVLDDISNVNLPNYRFSYQLQKANEFCNDVRGLGSSLLSAIEKKDAEDMALLRSGQEFNLLNSIKEMKQSQVDEAATNLEALNRTREVTQARFDYYNSRPKISSHEQGYLDSLKKTKQIQVTQANLQTTVAIMAILPQIHIQAPWALGPSFGGNHLGTAMQARASKLGVDAAKASYEGTVANTLGSYERRMDDWKFQAESAQKELAQIDKQIAAGEIRLAIAEKDLESQEIQIDNNRSVDEFMRSKYSNKELYNWMLSQISATYFQAYRLTYEMAKKAGKCYDLEVPLAKKTSDKLIQFGYWDSLKKGLLSGERLQTDLRKLEAAYMDENGRQFELTKHISLQSLSPEQLYELKATGKCDINIPEQVFDLDYPSHYNRRIKSVSISIPCVAGPYTTVPCTLTQTGESYVRIKPSTSLYDPNTIQDNWQVVTRVNTSSIATSNAQNDNGMFEFNFRDERYLPFEGAGVISTWSLALGGMKTTSGIELRPFDFDTISDVILHVKYTALDGFTTTRSQDVYLDNLKEGNIAVIDPNPPAVVQPLAVAFSLKHEYSNAWFDGFNNLVDNANNDTIARPLTIAIRHDQFPPFCKGKTIDLTTIHLYALPKVSGDVYQIEIEPATVTVPMELDTASLVPYHTSDDFDVPIEILDGSEIELSMNLYKNGTETVDEGELENFYVILEFKLD